MGDVRVKRVRRLSGLVVSRLGYTVSCLTAAAGIGWEFGPGWGMAVGGVIGAASFLLLVDVDERPDRGDDDGR